MRLGKNQANLFLQLLRCLLSQQQLTKMKAYFFQDSLTVGTVSGLSLDAAYTVMFSKLCLSVCWSFSEEFLAVLIVNSEVSVINSAMILNERIAFKGFPSWSVLCISEVTGNVQGPKTETFERAFSPWALAQSYIDFGLGSEGLWFNHSFLTWQPSQEQTVFPFQSRETWRL